MQLTRVFLYSLFPLQLPILSLLVQLVLFPHVLAKATQDYRLFLISPFQILPDLTLARRAFNLVNEV